MEIDCRGLKDQCGNDDPVCSFSLQNCQVFNSLPYIMYQLKTGKLLVRFSVCSFPGTPGPIVPAPVFTPINTRPYTLVDVVDY